MLPRHLRNAIYNWSDYVKRDYPSAAHELKEAQRKLDSGEIDQKEFEGICMILDFRCKIGNKAAGSIRLGAQDYFRYKIRKKVNTALNDLLLLLENINAISPEGKNGKPIIDPHLMDEVCAAWLGLARRLQYALKVGRGNSEYSRKYFKPPKFPISESDV